MSQPDTKSGSSANSGSKPAAADLALVGSGVTVLVATLSALVFTGVLERTPRNHPNFTIGAFILAIAAGALWLIAALKEDERAKRRLQIRGGFALAAGLVCIVIAVIWTYSEAETPTISAEVSDQLVLTAIVKASGLTSDEDVGVRVEGFQRATGNEEQEWKKYILYEAALGPNGSGVIDHPIRLPIASGTYELVRVRATTGDQYGVCPLDRVDPAAPLERQIQKTGCLVLTLPRFAVAPRVTAEWAGTPEQRQLRLTVKAENAAHRITVHVVTRKPRRRLAQAVLSPDGTGTIDGSIIVPVPHDARSLCAIARWHGRGAGHRRIPTPLCPPRINAGTAWVLLTAP